MLGINSKEIRQAIARGAERAVSVGKRRGMGISVADRLLGTKPKHDEARDQRLATVDAESVIPNDTVPYDEHAHGEASVPGPTKSEDGEHGNEESRRCQEPLETKSPEHKELIPRHEGANSRIYAPSRPITDTGPDSTGTKALAHGNRSDSRNKAQDREAREESRPGRKPESHKGYYTPRQAADILGTDLFEVNRLVRSGVFLAQSIDKHRWIPAKAFDDFVRQEYGTGKLVNAPKPQAIRKQEKSKPGEFERGKVPVNSSAQTNGSYAEDTRPNKSKKLPRPAPLDVSKVESIARKTQAYYTGEEAAEKLGLSADDVRYLAFLGRLKEEVVDGERVFAKHAIEALLGEQKASKPPQETASHTAADNQRETEPRTNGDTAVYRRSPQASEAPMPAIYYYTPYQAAEILGKSSAAIYRMIDRGRLPVVRLDARKYQWIPANVVIPAEAVRNLLPSRSSTRHRASRRAAIDPYQLTDLEKTRAETDNPSNSQNQQTPSVRSSLALPPGSSAWHNVEQDRVPGAPLKNTATGPIDVTEKRTPSDVREEPTTRGVDTLVEDSSIARLQGQDVADQDDTSSQVILSLDRLSKRTNNCLLRAGISTISDLQRCTPKQLLAIPNFGVKCLREVEALLGEWPDPSSDFRGLESSRRSSASYGNRTPPAGTSAASKRSSLDLPLRESFAYYLLSRRTQTRLAQASIWSINDLRTKTPEDLLSLDGFGAKCLNEVKTLLEAHGHRLGEDENKAEEWHPIPLENVPRPETLEDLLSLLARSASLRRRLEGVANTKHNLVLDAITRCQSKVEQQISQGTLDDEALLEWRALRRLASAVSPPPCTLTDLLFRLQYLACAGMAARWDTIILLDKALDAPTLDSETDQLMDRLSARDLYVLRARFRLNPKTLAELSEESGVTKQSIRNWEARAVAKLQQGYNELPLPRMRSAMSRAGANSVISPEGVARILRDMQLVHDDSAIENFLLVWRAIQPKSYPFPENLVSLATTGLTSLQRSLSDGIEI
jgi:hypothetical protein